METDDDYVSYIPVAELRAMEAHRIFTERNTKLLHLKKRVKR